MKDNTQSKGWVKLYRQVWDNPTLKGNTNYFMVWIWLISHAVHTPTDVIFNGERTTLQPGQLTCGQHQIAKDTGVTRSSVSRAMGRFVSEQAIEQRTDHQCSLITVKNWTIYQHTEQASEQRTNNARATIEQRPITNKELKNVKKERSKYSATRKKKLKRKTKPKPKNIPAQEGGEIQKAKPVKANQYQDPTPIDLKAKIKTMLEDDDRRMGIIAFYWVSSRQYGKIKTQGQFTHQLRRNLRAAGNLTGYPNEQIKTTMAYCARQFTDWTLETVEKYIAKPQDELSPNLTVV